jgi:hypothetical protein
MTRLRVTAFSLVTVIVCGALPQLNTIAPAFGSFSAASSADSVQLDALPVPTTRAPVVSAGVAGTVHVAGGVTGPPPLPPLPPEPVLLPPPVPLLALPLALLPPPAPLLELPVLLLALPVLLLAPPVPLLALPLVTLPLVALLLALLAPPVPPPPLPVPELPSSVHAAVKPPRSTATEASIPSVDELICPRIPESMPEPSAVCEWANVKRDYFATFQSVPSSMPM